MCVNLKEDALRVAHSEKLVLAKFKRSLFEYTDGEMSKFSVRVEDIIKAKRKSAEDTRVANAVAQATAQAAAPRGILGRLL